MREFIINEFYCKFPNPQKKPDWSFNENAWLLISGSDTKFEALKEICARQNIFNITKNNSVLGRVGSDSWRNWEKKCLVGVKPPIESDVYIVGDFICQVYFPAEFKNQFFAFDGTITDFSKLSMPDYFRLISSEALITLTIAKNPELADLLRAEGKKIFAEHGMSL